MTIRIFTWLKRVFLPDSRWARTFIAFLIAATLDLWFSALIGHIHMRDWTRSGLIGFFAGCLASGGYMYVTRSPNTKKYSTLDTRIHLRSMILHASLKAHEMASEGKVISIPEYNDIMNDFIKKKFPYDDAEVLTHNTNITFT